MSCDLITAWENGGIGAVVIALVWGLWSWWRHSKSGQQPAR